MLRMTVYIHQHAKLNEFRAGLFRDEETGFLVFR